jgi:hypothetical protein
MQPTFHGLRELSCRRYDGASSQIQRNTRGHRSRLPWNTAGREAVCALHLDGFTISLMRIRRRGACVLTVDHANLV